MKTGNVKPTFCKKLAEKVTAKKAAEKIGVSDGHLYNSLRIDEISLTYELAAENIYNKEFGDKTDSKCAIIHAPEHVIKTCHDLVTALGGKFHVVP